MSDRALKKATELVGQFLNRMPGPERQAPNEAEIRMATDTLLRGAPYAAENILQQPIKIAHPKRWKESGGVFWDWMAATGNDCVSYSTSSEVVRRMTDEELDSVMVFLRVNAEAILFPIENDDVAVKRVRRVPAQPPKECHVHADEGMEVDEDGWPTTSDDYEDYDDCYHSPFPSMTPVDQGTGKYGRQQRTASDTLHDEEGGPGVRM